MGGQNVQHRGDEQAGAVFATLGTGEITLPSDFGYLVCNGTGVSTSITYLFPRLKATSKIGVECQRPPSKSYDVIVAFPTGRVRGLLDVGWKVGKKDTKAQGTVGQGVSNANIHSIQGVLSLSSFLLPPITPTSKFLIELFSPQTLISSSFPKPSRGQ